MAKYFETEIRESYNKKYIKVFLKDVDKIQEVKSKISALTSVKNANVTESQNTGELSLTIYPNRAFDTEETLNDVEKELNSYYSGETETTIDFETVKETQDWLSKHPKSLKVYNEGINKYKEKKYERNLLDDMRLSLELLLKDVLKNEKSLENQKNEVGKYQKANGLSNEFTNMFVRLLDYYAKYQDEYIKHNDAVNSKEIDFIIQQTTAFMRSFI